MIGTVRFFDRVEIRDVLSYVRLVFNPNDTVSFERAINTPKVLVIHADATHSSVALGLAH
jgi:superfamily I DNA/RNA helicase